VLPPFWLINLVCAAPANERSGEEGVCLFGFHSSVLSLVDWLVHFTFTTSSGFQD